MWAPEEVRMSIVKFVVYAVYLILSLLLLLVRFMAA